MIRWLWLALAALAWWLIRRMIRQAAAGRPSGRPSERPAPRPETPDREAMVRDRVCNTFLPRSRALLLRDGSGEHFFCSERCRSAHRAGAVRDSNSTA